MCTLTSKVGLRSKEKQEAETGTQTLLELNWRLSASGASLETGRATQGLASRGGGRAGPGERRRWPVTRYREGRPARALLDTTPAVTPRRAPRPTLRESPKRAAAQRRTVPSSLGRATWPASPDAGGLTLRAVVHTVELPVRRQSVHGHRRGASNRHSTEQTPPRRGPHPSRCQGTWLPVSEPPPGSRASGRSALRTAGAAGKASPPPAPGEAAMVTVTIGVLDLFPCLAAVCVRSQAIVGFPLLRPGYF